MREPPTDLSACDVPSVCALRARSCCGSCGEPTATDMIAVRTDEVDAYGALVCPTPVACPACAGMPDPFLLATCNTSGLGAGHCVALDLHAAPLTECAIDSDCTLGPRRCCACGALTQLDAVAYNPSRGSLGALVCDPDMTCPPCAPDFGALLALCDAGRCVTRDPTL